MYKKKQRKKDTTVNKKVINAKTIVCDNISFKSKLELYAYKKLKEANLEFQYESKTFTLWEGFKPTNVSYFKPNSDNLMVINNTKVQNTTYTPDFVGNGWIIEVKGKENDIYPLKCKMFRKLIEDSGEYKLFLEPHSQKQVDECIQIISKFLVTI